LCTADGFNVCSIGVNETQLGKLAALSGSLFTMGAATLGSHHRLELAGCNAQAAAVALFTQFTSGLGSALGNSGFPRCRATPCLIWRDMPR
jgi:hypothetical protein